MEKVDFKDVHMEEVNQNNKPVNVGYDKMTVNMEKVLSKPPGFNLYRKVTKEDVEISVEESIAKLGFNHVNSETEQKDFDRQLDGHPSQIPCRLKNPMNF